MTIASPSAPPRRSGFQFRLATILIAMVWLGLACAALVTPTSFWVAVVSAITFFCLLMSLLLIIYRRASVRAFAIGFLVFGGGYGACVWWNEFPQAPGPEGDKVLSTTRAISWLYMRSHAKMTRLLPGGGMSMGGMVPAPGPVAVPRYFYQNFYEAAQFVLTMLMGLLGGIIATLLYLTRPENQPQRDSQEPFS